MASTEAVANGTTELSAAAKLRELHAQESHKPTIEDEVDDSDLHHPLPPTGSSVLEAPDDALTWAAPMSATAAGKQKETVAPTEKKMDLNSEQLFPGLGGGASKPAQTRAPGWPKVNGSNGTSTNGTSTPKSGVNTPPPVAQSVPRGTTHSLAGNITTPVLVLRKEEVPPRSQMKKPMPEILKDINKKLRTNLTLQIGENGIYEFRDNSNQKEAVKDQAIRDLGLQLGGKTKINISIPQSIRPHIIGKGGANIKAMQEATGAHIKMPKTEDTRAPVDEDDDMVDVEVEGNIISHMLARKAISKIASEKGASVTTKLRTIPAEFYPFLAGRAEGLESKHGVQLRVPPYSTWTAQRPPQKPLSGAAPAFVPAAGENHITFGGDRASVQAARQEIEQLAEQLRKYLTVDEISLDRGRHRYIVGDGGITPEAFLAETKCAIILPTDSDEEAITIVGPPDKIEAAMDHAMNLASTINQTSLDISRLHRQAPGGPRIHARNVTQYLRDRNAIEQIEKLHQTHIETHIDADGVSAWQIFSREGKNGLRAQNEITNMVHAYPPSRFATVPVDPFYHAHVQKRMAQKVKEDYGVHVVIPSSSESSAPVLLVFEGADGLSPDYQIPRGQPSADEVKAFQQGLADARAHILDIISKQATISSATTEVPAIFHEKLRKFVKKEQENRAEDQIPVRVWNTGTTVSFKGPTPAVESLVSKVDAFVVEAIEDEKNRGFTLSFDFPQKHASQLIGAKGSMIGELREKFDVDIKVDDGKVEIKGPEAKANAAKAHIVSLGKHWADETTYTLKVEPKFHSELIGAKGAQINKLQTRYKVQIRFPRSGKAAQDDASDAASEAGARKGGRRDQGPDEVVVKGPKKGADEARDEILSLLQYLKDNSFTASVSVQASQLPSLIGQGGSGMDEIRQLSGARVDIPNGRDLNPAQRVEIQLKGTKSQVTQAKKLIEEKRDVFDQTVTKSIEVDKKHHRALIGAGGSVLRGIIINAGGSEDRRELARTVQFPKAEQDGNTIKIEGKGDVVDKIIAAMQEIVSERESQVTESIDVPVEKHRSLIGRGGETKKDLESRFAVSIDIPRQGSEQTDIKITGLPVAVESAKTHILDLVKDQEGETVQVPRKIHHVVADNGLFFRKLRNDLQVTVDHAGNKLPPKPTQPSGTTNGGALPLITDDVEDTSDIHSWHVVDLSDSGLTGEIPWILRGNPENIAKARANLEKAIDQALKSTSTGYLGLPDPHTYRYVIGQGGSKVNSIRKATGCKITVPRDQSKDEKIEVVGSAEGIEKARQMILEAVKAGSANQNGAERNGASNWE